MQIQKLRLVIITVIAVAAISGAAAASVADDDAEPAMTTPTGDVRVTGAAYVACEGGDADDTPWD